MNTANAITNYRIFSILILYIHEIGRGFPNVSQGLSKIAALEEDLQKGTSFRQIFESTKAYSGPANRWIKLAKTSFINSK